MAKLASTEIINSKTSAEAVKSKNKELNIVLSSAFIFG
jgi:hypothetical protein